MMVQHLYCPVFKCQVKTPVLKFQLVSLANATYLGSLEPVL